MALNPTTISPALIKAKNVATEDYVDTQVANVDVSDSIPTTYNSADTPNGATLIPGTDPAVPFPLGSIWRQAVTVNTVPQYIHYIYVGAGVWDKAGGTYIDGSNIVTGSIDASLITTGAINSSTWVATSGVSGMRVDLDNNYIVIRS